MSQKENSGGLVNYYLAYVEFPQREEQPAYTAECEDIIDALGMTPDEANIFKELWRTCNERTHGKGKEGNTPLRAAQKMVHYSGRILKKAKRAHKIDETIPSRPKFEPVWVVWDGRGLNPVIDAWSEVEVGFRDGTKGRGIAGSFMWQHRGMGRDIVKYRVIGIPL